MKKLISMTDYVLELDNNNLTEYKIESIFKYAHFLKQPLELWMFVPCDKDGNVLEMPQPIINDIGNIIYQERFKQYQQAKEKCLFERFEIYAVNHHIKMERSLEYLSNFGTLKLTPTAIKQLGL